MNQQVGDEANMAQGEESITLNVWDFGGKAVQTHHIFFASNAIYLVVVDLSREDFDTDGMEGLEYWIRSIRSYASNASIRIIATHTDLVSDNALRSKLNTVYLRLVKMEFDRLKTEDVFKVSSIESADDVRDRIRSHLLELARTKHQVLCPTSWVLLLDKISSEKLNEGQLSTLNFSQVKEFANTTASMLGDDDIIKALEFFHNQGLLLHFNEAKLKNIIIQKPVEFINAFHRIVTIVRFFDYQLSAPEAVQLRERGRLDNNTIRRVWIQENYSSETQEFLRALLVKFGIALEEDEGLIIPSLIERAQGVEKDGKETKRWTYIMKSVTPPLAFISMLIGRLLKLVTSSTWELYRDGCSLVLHKLEVSVHINSSSVNIYVETAEDGTRMASAIMDLVSAIRFTHRTLVRSERHIKGVLKGVLKGQCLRCSKNTIIKDDLDELKPLYEQFCGQQCQKEMGSLTRSFIRNSH